MGVEELSGEALPPEKVSGGLDTPARVLYRILHETGWAERKSDFAKVVNIRQKNAYMYLDDGQGRIKASAETMFAWVRMVEYSTGLRVSMELSGGGQICLRYSGETGGCHPGLEAGRPLSETVVEAFEPAWMDDAREHRAEARRQTKARRRAERRVSRHEGMGLEQPVTTE